MQQLLLLVLTVIGSTWGQPCAPQPTKWMSPINLQAPRFEPSFHPLHVFAFLDGGEGLVAENTGDTVRIVYPIRPDIHSTPANLTDIQISKGPLADEYTAHHVEFRWGPESLPTTPSSTGGAVILDSSSTAGASESSSSTAGGGPFLLDLSEMVTAAPVAFGSDHGFSGRYFPFEMQIFFYNVKYKTYEEALAASPQEPDHSDVNEDVVALSVLFEVGAQNEELTKITDRLELIRTAGTTTNIIAKMCFEKILNKGRDFITYPGSLTRAPCTRGVRWVVLVEPLTLSQAQLDEFRQIGLTSTTDWTPPLDHALFGRLIQTNLRELPLDDKFIPDFKLPGPPVSYISNKNKGGVAINPHASSLKDLNEMNYWSPYDYTIQDDAAPVEVSTGPAMSTGGTPAESTGNAEVSTVAEPPSTAGGGDTGVTAPSGPFLVEQGLSSTTDEEPPTESSTSHVLPVDTAETGAASSTAGTESSSTVNAHVNEPKVTIPHFFDLGSTAYFTPDIQSPHTHDHKEDGHYHPPSLNDLNQEDASFRKQAKAKHTAQNDLSPQQAQAQSQSQHPRRKFLRHWKMV